MFGCSSAVEQPAPAYNPASGTGASPESDTLDEAKERAVRDTPYSN